jgi:peptidoglycan-associated lipoprotein
MIVTRRLAIGIALALAVVVSACAKRPSPEAGASAPAPPGAPVAAAPAPAPTPLLAHPGDIVPPAPPTPRPRPAGFVAREELKDVYFDFDKATIRPDAARTLNASAAWLVEHPGHAVLIEGHCDERGTNEYNLALGDRRAQAARNYLVSRGVAASRFRTISYGEERPVCAERTEACWWKNRRAHFLAKPE